jgi:hypothetical protein
VPQLLASKDREVVLHALSWVCGGFVPWPGWELRPKRKPMTEHVRAVETLLTHDAAEVRCAAACVYGNWAGPASQPRLRLLLADFDPKVRAMAIRMLVRMNDRSSTEAIITALKGIEEPYTANDVVSDLGEWQNQAVVPALISYLQNDAFGGSVNAEIHTPSLVAQTALHKLTGHWFPLDVSASTEFWNCAQAIPDKQEREKYLTRTLPAERCPFTARLVREGNDLQVVVTNRSNARIVLARLPEDVQYSYDFPTGGSASRSFALGPRTRELTKESYVALAPGESTRFTLTLDDRFAVAQPASRELGLLYKRNGNAFGVNAWIGALPVATEGVTGKQ